jgi:hypothetical protein
MGVWDLWGIMEVAGMPESIYRRLEGSILSRLSCVFKFTDVEKLAFIIRCSCAFRKKNDAKYFEGLP